MAKSKTNLMGASHEWASRPADERYWNINELLEKMIDVKANGAEKTPYVRSLRATAVDVPGYDSPDLRLTSNLTPANTIQLTHWSYGQLSRFVGAPADYLRSLPAPVAATCINHGLERIANDNREAAASVLLHKGPDALTLRSMTTDRYSRLWNADLVRAISPALDTGWMTPPARPAVEDSRARRATLEDIVPGQDGFGLSVKVGDLIAPAGCYASDHDLFVFLLNRERIIDLDGSGAMMRGMFMWNSEVGAGALKIQTFLLEAVCGNHIVWGASDVRTYRKVHKGQNFTNIRQFGGEMARSLVSYGNSSTDYEMNRIKAARNYVLGQDEKEVKKVLHENRSLALTQKVIDVAWRYAERHEDTAKVPPTHAWGMVHGMTRASQESPFADERNQLDSAAGKLLQLAYAAKT